MVDRSSCLFQMIGLHPNYNKTKFMVTLPKPFRNVLSFRSYSNVTRREKYENREYHRHLIKCEVRGTNIQWQNMVQHMRFVHLIHDYYLPNYACNTKVYELPGYIWTIHKKETSCPRPECNVKGPNNTMLRYHVNCLHPEDTLQGED